MINADGTGARTLVSDAATKNSPTWSPDGSRIAFARTEFTGTAVVAGIYAVNADGSGLVQLTSNAGGGGFAFGGDSAPSWSPDGGRLIVSSTGSSGTGIDVINSDGSGRISLTAGSGNNDRNPAWSPDGQQIAFERAGSTGSHIHIMNTDGTGLRQVTPGRGYYTGPDWGSSQTAPRPLSLVVTGPRSQRLDKRNRLHLFGQCNRACVVTASASARVGKKRVRNDTRTRKRANTQLDAGKKTKIYMKFLAKPARVIRRALARNKRVVLKVELKAVEAGVPAPVTVVRRIRVRYP